MITGVGGSFLVHILAFATAFIAVWTMPHKPIKPPFCTVNLVSLKDLGTGNSEPKGVPKGSEETKAPEAPKSFARTAEKSGPVLPVKRLHLDESPRRQEIPIKKMEPKEAPKMAETPQSLSAIEKNLDKLIVKPKVTPRTQAASDAAQEAPSRPAAQEPVAPRIGRTAVTESAPRGSASGSTDAGARGTAQGSIAGSPEGSSAMNALTAMYGEKVVAAVRREWTLLNDQGVAGLKAIVEVQIRKNGEIIGIQVVKASGNSMFDESAVRAVRKAAPLPPVPEAILQSTTKLILTFLPDRVS